MCKILALSWYAVFCSFPSLQHAFTLFISFGFHIDGDGGIGILAMVPAPRTCASICLARSAGVAESEISIEESPYDGKVNHGLLMCAADKLQDYVTHMGYSREFWYVFFWFFFFFIKNHTPFGSTDPCRADYY